MILYTLPLPEEQNGVISGYDIELTNLDLGIVKIFQTSRTEFLIERLRPHTVYQVAVAAHTAVGIGPYSELITFMTEEDGEYSLHIIRLML